MSDFRSLLNNRASPDLREAASEFNVWFSLERVISSFPKVAGSFQSPRMAEFAQLAETFHRKANTYTDSVVSAIHRIKSGTPIIRLFHQPNTMTALNILGQIHIAKQLSVDLFGSSENAVTLFILQDYDTADDNRFRSAPFPVVTGNGLTYLKGAVPKQYRDCVSFAVPSPPFEIHSRWMSTLVNSVRLWQKMFQRNRMNIYSRSELWGMQEVLLNVNSTYYSTNNSVAIANSYIMSWIANQLWLTDVLFIPASWLLPYSYSDLLSLVKQCIEQTDEINKTLLNLYEYFDIKKSFKPFVASEHSIWRVCHGCFARRAVNIQLHRDGTISGSWVCDRCDLQVAEELEDYRFVDSSFGELPALLPRVNICDLLESTSHGFSLGVNYAGGLEHMIRSRAIGKTLSISPPHDLVWEPLTLFAQTSYDGLIPSLSSDQIGKWKVMFSEAKFPTVFYWLLFQDFDFVVSEVLMSV